MAGEIKQVMSFDTSGAVKAIDALDTRLGTFGSSLGMLAGQLQTFSENASKAFKLGDTTKNIGNVNKALNKLGTGAGIQGIQRVGEGLTEAGNKAETSRQKFDSLFQDTAKNATQAGDAVQKGFGKQATKSVTGFGDTVQTAATKVQSNFGRVGVAMSQLGTRVRTGMGSAQKAVANFAETGGKNFKGLIISFQTFARIISTQVIIRAFSQLQQALSASVQDNIKFQRSIREIGTILPDAERNADHLAQAVRGISDAFNLPLGDVAEGLYQTVSNQIGNAAESILFLQEAAKFSKVAVASLTDSVNLLSGVLNAFQRDASDASIISAQLFKTIELGRTRASELANSLGRVIPVMRSLGVTTSETFAAIATLTIQGQKTSEALTQLRGAANALLKPTKATQKALAQLGFDSAEALIAARGLAGAFQSLRGQTDGSLEAFAKLVPRVRGMNAALSLTGQGADRFEANLRKIDAAAQDTLDQEFKFVFEHNAEAVSISMNKLANVFADDLGGALNDSLAAIGRWTGGIETVRVIAKTLAPVFIGAAAALALYAGGLAAATIATKIFTAFTTKATLAMGAFATAAVGLGVVVGVYLLAKAAANAYAEGVENARQRMIDANEAQEQSLARTLAAERELENNRFRRLNSQVQEEIALFNKFHKARLDGAKKTNDDIIKDQERVVGNVISATQAILKATEGRVKSEKQLRTSAISNFTSLTNDLADLQFKNDNKKLKDLQKFSNLEQRATELASQGRQQLGAATTEADAAAARAILDRAEGFTQEASSLAEQLEHKKALQRSEDLAVTVLQQKIDGEKALAIAAGQRVANEAARAKAQRQELVKLLNLAQAVKDTPGLFDDAGAPLRGDALTKAVKSREDALKNFQDAIVGAEAFDISDLVEISKLSLDVEKELSRVQIQSLTMSDKAALDLHKSLEFVLKDFEASFGGLVIKLELATGLDIETPKETSQALNRLIPQARQLAEVQGKIVIAQNKIANTASEAAKSYGLLSKGFDRNTSLAARNRLFITKSAIATKESGRRVTDTTKQFAFLYNRMRQLSKEAILVAQAGGQIDLTDLENTLLTINQLPTPDAFNEQVPEMTVLIGSLREIVALQQGINKTRAAGEATGVGSFETQTKNTAEAAKVLEEKYGEAADKVKEAADAQAKVPGQVSASTTALGGMNQALAFGVSATAQILSNLRQASQISFAAPQATQTAATGGMMHFAQGGGPRGTDTIPAWLSPGEFVVPARQARRFYPQLQAMTAGVQPIYRQDGGSVTNVGDINVTMGSGNQSDQATGRNIARSIRRELRRNTSQL